MNLLKGESSGAAELLGSLLGGAAGASSGKNDDILSSLLGGNSGKNDILGMLLGAKRELPEGAAGEEPGEIPETDPLKEIK